MPEYLNKEILILGCGNVLFGDDGFGYAVVNKLNALKEKIPALNSNKIGIIDAGTGASHYILSLIDEDTPIKKIIIIDAIDFGLKPGELIKLYPNDLPKIKKYYIDAHDMPLAGLIKEINEKYGIEVVVIGCQSKNMTAPDICLELSEEVKNAVDRAVEMVLDELLK
ncbi:coenzyme F420-reducing hydrogenase, FrhD protein [Methanotorris igneus]|uniref:Coenzyme F420-reducing hydrogenase delta subunit n=1 Tax=Methanotorris igneus (strain DSM 5666 / JCM 11834 / Kol 5) TaxID=880724 RepID=F6BE62_METIK|nr:coenzyme F420-reducing hydrogenase, FrhD protein [Methanotorris igneus]AEF96739.1 coenzyme F420-reducing hydrogenase delta subunit [Methanotorris igneus Kol 5]